MSEDCAAIQIPADCPILAKRDTITGLSRSMVRTIRRIKQDLNACGKCPASENCLVLREFNSQISVAIQEIQDEWDLASAVIRSS
ncbi:hypothetical protein ACFLV7_15760 [Chloroflexota bacterium]